ncbi:MAG: bifunctional adenosylcobinamide kinase/adenosylcobinamide-phosphate guanylyltransferase [Acutalibacteraceae bacterium]
MIFVYGPLFSGKRTFAARFPGPCQADAQELAAACPAEQLEALADRLAADNAVVLAVETGAGVVPVDRAERENREKAGRLACLLAERADTVVRMCCGIPEVLKGELPS